MNKPVYSGFSILEINKTLMHEFWHDYVKPKYEGNAKLCYMDTDSFIIHIKTEDFYKGIPDDVKKWLYTRHYCEDGKTPLPNGMNKKVIGIFKDELEGKIMIEFFAIRPKTCSYLMDDGSEHKKAKGKKRKCITKREIMFNNYKDCLFKNKIILKSQQKFKIKANNVYTEKINKIPLVSNDD